MITIKHIGTVSKVENGVRYTRDEYEVGKYIVHDYVRAKIEDGTTFRSITISEADVAAHFERRSYLPEIYYIDDFFGTKENRFEIQTTSYGALTVDEFKKFMEAQQHAFEVAEALTVRFINK